MCAIKYLALSMAWVWLEQIDPLHSPNKSRNIDISEIQGWAGVGCPQCIFVLSPWDALSEASPVGCVGSAVWGQAMPCYFIHRVYTQLVFKPKQALWKKSLERNCLLWGWWDTERGCPEKPWMAHLWKCPWPGRVGLGATWSSGSCACPWWEGLN